MNEFINYLIQVSALLILLYLPYQFMFRKETRFMLNRSYLLTILFIAWVIPVINIPLGHVSPELQIFPLQLQVPVLETHSQSLNLAEISQSENQAVSFNWLHLYWIGAVILLIRNLWVIARIIRLGQRSDRYRNSHYQVVVRDDIPAFTFFRKIFLSRKEYELAGSSLVLRHELAHLRQRHSQDLILAEFAHTILWFNPIMILYKRALKETHEYLADRAVLNEGIDFQCYAQSLQDESIQSRYQNLVSHFKGSTIKNRIVMATQTPKAKSIRKYFLILPILLGCLILWSFIQDPVVLGSRKVTDKNLVVLIDPGHGGKDKGAPNPGSGASEKDLCLALALQLEKVPHPGIDFVFTRKSDQFLSFRTRTKLAEKNKADLFLTLHMNSNKNQKIKGSDFYYLSSHTQAIVSREICRKMGTELQATRHQPDNEPFGTANLAVLWGTTCPAVYYSFGYISNVEEASTFSDPGNQESLAKKIIKILQEIKKEGVLPVK